VRWENSTEGSGTPYRTLVCYKETLASQPLDPADPPTWTGTWRDIRFSPPADGGRPENSLTGNLYEVTEGAEAAIVVPAADGRMRFWRQTDLARLAPGSAYKLPVGTLGYEWDEDVGDASRPAGVIHLSTTTMINEPVLQDYGANYVQTAATHHLTLYRASSGALVFDAGTIQWSWGLDGSHDRAGPPTDRNMQQATVNLLADMHVQPSTLQGRLSRASPSSDTVAPTSRIAWPAIGAVLLPGQEVVIRGTATDVGGEVGGVEVSTDGGASWHAAAGRSSWSYTWTPSVLGLVSVQSRAVDDSGNIGRPSSAVTVNIAPRGCPCSLWGDWAVPKIRADVDARSVEVGIRFRADQAGFITGIRFYKAPANQGTHIASLWSSGGQLLAQATFSQETASGWQQVNFTNPVAISANTVYIASYHAPNGHYAQDTLYFAASGYDDPPLHALPNSLHAANGVYNYTSDPAFPSSTYNSTNYWVDVVFVPAPRVG
jgi:hypothetical protein